MNDRGQGTQLQLFLISIRGGLVGRVKVERAGVGQALKRAAAAPPPPVAT